MLTRLKLIRLLFIFKICIFYVQELEDFACCRFFILNSIYFLSVYITTKDPYYIFLCSEYTNNASPSLWLFSGERGVFFVKVYCTLFLVSVKFISTCAELVAFICSFWLGRSVHRVGKLVMILNTRRKGIRLYSFVLPFIALTVLREMY